jgi:asparagine synthase (glutamine-hydrolysing)
MGEADQELHRMTSSVGCESAYWGSTQSFSDGQASFVWREPVGCRQHISAFTRSGGLKNIQAVGSVRLDNGDALRKEFGLPAFSTDLQILVHAFERNGRQGFPKNIYGDFAVSIWQPDTQSLFCCSDHLGIRSLYYTLLGNCIRFAWRQEALIQPSEVDSYLDPAGIACYLGGRDSGRNTRGTYFTNLARVRPGHFIVYESGRVCEERFWFPENIQKQLHLSQAEWAGAFRQRLSGAVASRLPKNAPVWFDASGGIDSTSVIHLAHAELSASGQRASELMFCRSIVPSSTPEFSELEDMQEALRSLHLETELESLEDLPPVSQLADSSRGWRGELALGSIALAETKRLCDRVLQTGASAHLTGHGADHLLGSPNLLYIRNLLRHGQIGRAHKDLKIWSAVSSRPYVNLLLDRVFFPDCLGRRSCSQPQVASWATPLARKTGVDPVEYFPLEHLGDAADTEWFNHLLEGAALLRTISNCSEQFGVEKRFPYADVRLIEFVLSMPAEERSRPPLPKWLLRESMNGVVPEKIRLKQYQPTGDAAFMCRLRRDRDALNQIVTQPILENFDLVDVAKLRPAFEAILQGDNREISHFVRFLTTEFWLRNICSRRTQPVGRETSQQVACVPNATIV